MRAKLKELKDIDRNQDRHYMILPEMRQYFGAISDGWEERKDKVGFYQNSSINFIWGWEHHWFEWIGENNFIPEELWEI